MQLEKLKKTPRAVMNSARGEHCTLNIAGVCNYDRATTVYCHFPDGSGGSNKLTGPLNGGYGCSECHACIDNRKPPHLPAEDREFYMRRSTNRTLNRLIERDLLRLEGL